MDRRIGIIILAKHILSLTNNLIHTIQYDSDCVWIIILSESKIK